MLPKSVPIVPVAFFLSIGSALAGFQNDCPGGYDVMLDNTGKSAADRSSLEALQKMGEAISATDLTGDPNRDYVRLMISHHKGAIDVAADQP